MSALTAHLRRMWRAALQPTSLLDLGEVVDAVPGRPQDVEAWILENVAPAGQIAGRDVYRWGDVLDAMASSAPKRSCEDHDREPRHEPDTAHPVVQVPLTSWREVAEACGVSEDTLARRRRDYDPKARALFATREEAWAWFSSLGRTPPRGRPTRRSPDPGPTLASRTRG